MPAKQIPVSFEFFKKYTTNHEELVDTIFKSKAKKNSKMYEIYKNSKEDREKALKQYYEAFYLNPEIRQSYHICLKPVPKHIKDKLLQVPPICLSDSDEDEPTNDECLNKENNKSVGNDLPGTAVSKRSGQINDEPLYKRPKLTNVAAVEDMPADAQAQQQPSSTTSKSINILELVPPVKLVNITMETNNNAVNNVDANSTDQQHDQQPTTTKSVNISELKYNDLIPYEHYCPVQLKDFIKYTNVVPIVREELRKNYGNDTKLDEYCHRLYLKYYLQPDKIRQKQFCLQLKFNEDCPDDIKAKIYEIATNICLKDDIPPTVILDKEQNNNLEFSADQQQPTTSKSVNISEFEPPVSIDKPQNNILLPVSYDKFKRSTFFEEHVDKLFRLKCQGNEKMYAELKNSEAAKETAFREYYEAYYLTPKIRETMPIRFKPVPRALRDKLLQIPIQTNTNAVNDLNANSSAQEQPTTSKSVNISELLPPANLDKEQNNNLPISPDQQHDQPSTSKIENISALKPPFHEQQNNNWLPVTYDQFKKSSFFEEHVDKLIKSKSKGNEKMYAELMHSEAAKETAFREYYEAYYLTPKIRETMPIRFRPVPRALKDKLLQIPRQVDLLEKVNLLDANSTAPQQLPPPTTSKSVNLADLEYDDLKAYEHCCPVQSKDFQKYTNIIQLIRENLNERVGNDTKLDEYLYRFHLRFYLQPDKIRSKACCIRLRVNDDCPADIKEKIFEIPTNIYLKDDIAPENIDNTNKELIEQTNNKLPIDANLSDTIPYEKQKSPKNSVIILENLLLTKETSFSRSNIPTTTTPTITTSNETLPRQSVMRTEPTKIPRDTAQGLSTQQNPRRTPESMEQTTTNTVEKNTVIPQIPEPVIEDDIKRLLNKQNRFLNKFRARILNKCLVTQLRITFDNFESSHLIPLEDILNDFTQNEEITKILLMDKELCEALLNLYFIRYYTKPTFRTKYPLKTRCAATATSTSTSTATAVSESNEQQANTTITSKDIQSLERAKRIFFHNTDKSYSLSYLLLTTFGLKQNIIRQLFILTFEEFCSLTSVYEGKLLYSNSKDDLGQMYKYVFQKCQIWPTNLFVKIYDLCKFLQTKNITFTNYGTMLKYISPKFLHWSDLYLCSNFEDCVAADYERRTGIPLDVNDAAILKQELNNYYNRCWKCEKWIGATPLLSEQFMEALMEGSNCNNADVTMLEDLSGLQEVCEPPLEPLTNISTVELAVTDDNEYMDTHTTEPTKAPNIIDPSTDAVIDHIYIDNVDNEVDNNNMDTHTTEPTNAPNIKDPSTDAVIDHNYVLLPNTQQQIAMLPVEENVRGRDPLGQSGCLARLNISDDDDTDDESVEIISNGDIGIIVKKDPSDDTKPLKNLLFYEDDNSNILCTYQSEEIITLDETIDICMQSPPTTQLLLPNSEDSDFEGTTINLGQRLPCSADAATADSRQSMPISERIQLQDVNLTSSGSTNDNTKSQESITTTHQQLESMLNSIICDDNNMSDVIGWQNVDPIPSSLEHNETSSQQQLSSLASFAQQNMETFQHAQRFVSTFEESQTPPPEAAQFFPSSSEDSLTSIATTLTKIAINNGHESIKYVTISSTPQISNMLPDIHDVVSSTPLISNTLPDIQHVASSLEDSQTPPTIAIQLDNVNNMEKPISSVRNCDNDNERNKYVTIRTRTRTRKISSTPQISSMLPEIPQLPSSLENLQTLDNAINIEKPISSSVRNCVVRMTNVKKTSSNFVEQKLHPIRPLAHSRKPAQTSTKQKESSTLAEPSSSSSSSSLASKHIHISQELTTNCTVFNNTSLLKMIDQNYQAESSGNTLLQNELPQENIQKSTKVSDNSKNKSSANLGSQTQPDNESKKVNTLKLTIQTALITPHQPSAPSPQPPPSHQIIQKYCLFHDLVQFKFFKELSNQHIAQYLLPSLDITKTYAEATIIGENFKTKICNNSIAAIFPHWSKTMLKDFLIILNDLKEFHYTPFRRNRLTLSQEDLRSRVLFWFIYTSSKFAHCHLLYESNSMEFAQLEAVRNNNNSSYKRKPFVCLTKSLDHTIMVKLKDIKNNLKSSKFTEILE